ncbi:MAG TPA: aminotransferase class IV [Puia sp.]|nr:aminotransferase class IV [Puia sp.]
MIGFINYNGEIIPADIPVLNSTNRGFRYGDGLFESIRVTEGNMPLRDFHFDRLFSSMAMLGFDSPPDFSRNTLLSRILDLCQRNNCHDACRVRLIVFRGAGTMNDVQDNLANYIIQAEELPEKQLRMNDAGLELDLFSGIRKTCDSFSSIKSNNYMLFSLAARQARLRNLDDAFILNIHDRLCEATVSNVFAIRDKTIYTPPLSEGCIAGVMRRWVQELLRKQNILCRETPLTVEMIKQCDEIFLTNAIFGIRWVGRFREITYGNGMTREIFALLNSR